MRVSVVDIDVPLGSLVVLMFKLAVAAIPAGLAFWLAWWMLAQVFQGII
jgi:hypothetical protein